MSISFNSGSWQPPKLSVRIGAQSFSTILLPPALSRDVTGFDSGSSGALSQEQVDRAMTRLQQMIDQCPEDEREVFAALLNQSDGFAADRWLAD
jgi:hypothetical protein